LVAIASYLLRLDVARGHVAMAMPAGMIGLLVARWLWRKWLTMHRAQGLMSASVLVVGDREHVTGLIRAMNSAPETGYRLVAACCGDAEHGDIGTVPVLGDESEAAEVVQRIGANTVACSSYAMGLRRLGWALEGQEVDLLVVPRLIDVAGPRVLTRPVAGLSLLHVGAPVFAGPQLAVKTAIDRIAAAALLILLLPLFAVVAVLIRRDRGGRCSSGRSASAKMAVVPDAQVPNHACRSRGDAVILAAPKRGSRTAVQAARPPRITPFGAKLRRYSLDELPRLVNVLRGQMSLVGRAYPCRARSRPTVTTFAGGCWSSPV
jgi:hypothetical protein